MLRTNTHAAHISAWLAILIALPAMFGTEALWADSDDDIRVVLVRVEQDWELVVGTPDQDNNAPQITCTISPLGNVSTLHAALTLNQQTSPTYLAGGMQLQVWNGEYPVSQATGSQGIQLATPEETITWTQTMELSGSGSMTFQVTDGHSTSWGDFGGERLKLDVPTTLTSLNSYRTSVSTANSGVSFAGNRVRSLTLKRVRYVLSTGDRFEWDTNHVVCSQR